jgi:preprotein translocase subunit SecG
MTTYLISLTICFFALTVVLSLINYKLYKSLKRAENEAQYWCEQYVMSNKKSEDLEKYEDVI